jgi:hypothetical protein
MNEKEGGPATAYMSTPSKLEASAEAGPNTIYSDLRIGTTPPWLPPYFLNRG